MRLDLTQKGPSQLGSLQGPSTPFAVPSFVRTDSNVMEYQALRQDNMDYPSLPMPDGIVPSLPQEDLMSMPVNKMRGQEKDQTIHQLRKQVNQLQRDHQESHQNLVTFIKQKFAISGDEELY